MALGYCGKILRINLSNKTIKKEELTESTMRKYMGGKGLIAYYLNKELDKDIDPLNGKENILYFMTGIMSGIPAAGTSRIVIGGKSPLTGGFGNAESGGFLATEFKKAGWDGAIIEGKAEKPVYIYIEDDKVVIKDALHLWGKETGEVYDKIKKELGNNRIRMSQIGPAGENEVLYSCIINDLKHACGRNGLGAIMGSKNLKAIAVLGSKDIEFQDKQNILEVSKWYSSYCMKNPLSYGLYHLGTAGGVSGFNAAGMLPTRNFKDGSFEKAEEISGQKMADTILKKREGCYACPVRCKRIVELENEKFKVSSKYGGPEYETVASMGSLCGIGNIEIVAKAHEMCNRYGLDTISAGVSIAFGMECFEKGLINKNDTDGLELRFGNEDVLLEMIKRICYKIGFGKILALGVKRASEIIGQNSEDFAMQVKGQELAMHEPRGKAGVGLGYVLSPTGADHMQIAHDTMFSKKGPVLDAVKTLGINNPIDPLSLRNEKVRMYAYLEMWWSFLNMAGVCDFIPEPRGSMPIEKLIELLKSATGWNVSLWELMKVGERGINLARIYNYKCGLTKEAEKLPKRLHEPLNNGKLKGKYIDEKEFEEAKKLYYKMMNMDENGYPKEEKLIELGIN